MRARRYVVTVETNASGVGVGYTPRFNGNVLSIQYVKAGSNAYADGVAIEVTGETTGETIWSESSVNASMIRRPRLAIHDSDGGEQTVAETYVVVDERIKISVTGGGDTKTGDFVITVAA